MHPYSTCTHRVWAVANEIGVNVELFLVDLFKVEHKDTKFIENYNPFGLVPVLEVQPDEDGTKLYESRAICRYLIAKYAPESELLPNPSDVKKYGLFEQAASIEYSSFDRWGASITIGRVIAPMAGWPIDDEEVKKAINTLTSNMEAYDPIMWGLTRRVKAFTFADLSHLPFVQLIGGGTQSLPGTPGSPPLNLQETDQKVLPMILELILYPLVSFSHETQTGEVGEPPWVRRSEDEPGAPDRESGSWVSGPNQHAKACRSTRCVRIQTVEEVGRKSTRHEGGPHVTLPTTLPSPEVRFCACGRLASVLVLEGHPQDDRPLAIVMANPNAPLDPTISSKI
ncbi:hypothetical protein AG1IA_00711 [Rhizoctonia solani AG-1 IA]|uniref:glutathione transferase n=1 Tax=Thanatephorus cucumeris (strain AG1-IA) TaxID=983506 RepID=L8X4Z1_THACA|nr:hypothetical protein AG1IA_00711 [Rhizoctonia solani AG-1 IA]